ncbi:MAG TPA: HEAT repeat domain-containing protein [Thermoanaerobaculia bacterium]|nr:HEAT repeat domain-containing protein [Thermoanaerobaculia bacterium]
MSNRTFEVFISSTMRELGEERAAIEEIVCILGEMCRVVAVRAEHFLARSVSPEYACIERAATCDVYVGIFDKRWGYVPRKDNPHQLSVSALEYEAARQAGRPRLVFVSRLAETERDPELAQWLNRIGDWKNGVFWNAYDSLATLRVRAVASLALELLKFNPTEEQRQGLDRFVEARVKLQRATIDRFQFLRFNWLGQLRTVIPNMPLDAVCVELTAFEGAPIVDILDEAMRDPDGSGILDTRYSLLRSYEMRTVPIEELIKGNRVVVVLGNPGGGKTTLLKRVALAEARAGRIPLFIELGRFAAWVRDASSGEPPRTLPAFILRSLAEQEVQLAEDELEKWLRSGECTLLLDGLDEVWDVHWRNRVSEAAMATLQRYRGTARAIVTSRIVGYKSAPLTGEIVHCTIRDLEPSAIKEFVERWFEWMRKYGAHSSVTGYSAGGDDARRILVAIQSSDHISRLARNPLMLTVLLLIYHQGSRLPERRIELYEKCTEAFVDSIDAVRFEPKERPIPGNLSGREVRDLLVPLAFDLHGRGQRLPTAHEVEQSFASTLASDRGLSLADARLLSRDLLLYIRERTGLFVERGLNEYGFVHLTFEEYFAALAIAGPRNLVKSFREHVLPVLHNPHWRECVLLAAGAFADRQREDAEEFIRLIARAKSNPYESLLGLDLRLAIRCLGDDVPVREPFYDEIERMVRAWIAGAARLALDRLAKTASEVAGTRIAERLVPIAIEASRRADGYERARAARMLGNLGVHRALPRLEEMLKGGDKPEGWETRVAFGKLASRDDLPRVYEMLYDKESHWVCLAASAAFENLVTAADLPLLGEMLSDSNERVRVTAVTALGKVGSRKELPKVREMLEDTHYWVRDSAAEVIGILGARDDLSILKRMLRDESSSVHLGAMGAFAKLGTRDDLPSLQALLYDEEGVVRPAVVMAIGKLATRDDLPSIQALLHDEQSSVRRAVVAAYARLGTHDDLKALQEALQDTDQNVRDIAVETFGILGTPDDRLRVINMLDDKHEFVRLEACKVLSKLGTNDDIPRLQEMLRDPHPKVWEPALEAIEAIVVRESSLPIYHASRGAGARDRKKGSAKVAPERASRRGGTRKGGKE